MTPVIEPDQADIQGLILRGYTHPFSCHLLLQLPDAPPGPGGPTPAVQAFFRTLYPLVQNAEDWGDNKPAHMLNLGLTASGLRKANVLSATELQAFPSEFLLGPGSPASQTSLGDTGSSDLTHWWAAGVTADMADCVAHAYGLTQADLDALTTQVVAAAHGNGVQVLWQESQGQLPEDEIHFGYRDGISDPPLTLSGAAVPDPGDLSNFLIGYHPDSSFSKPGPVQSDDAEKRAQGADMASPSGPDGQPYQAWEFARNGCYNAFRIIYQDVAAFNRMLEQQGTLALTQAIVPGPSPDQAQAEEWVAAKIVGRWRNGSPLMVSPNAPDPATWNAEDFDYVEPSTPNDDKTSTLRCPFAAHTRVANPRHEVLALSESPPVPRILRRGMPYGPPLNGTIDDGVDRGLIGLFLCGSLSRQFEKVYGWLNSCNFAENFSPYPTPQDALLGNRNKQQGTIGLGFDIPLGFAPAKKFTIKSLPELLITRGTAYCLLPSMTSLRRLAGLPA